MASRNEIVFQKVFWNGEIGPLSRECYDEVKVTSNAVFEVLRIHFGNGPDANRYRRLATNKIIGVFEEFTKPGDTFICAISSLKITCEAENFELSLVVKMHKLESEEFCVLFGQAAFLKEIPFYKTMLPMLNDRLGAINLQPLKFPKYYSSIDKEMEQVIFFEDLRARGFKMADSTRGLDKFQSSLVMKELGRLHAVSKLVLGEEEAKHGDVISKYPMFKEIWGAVFPNQLVKEYYWLKGINFALIVLHENSKPKFIQIRRFLENMLNNIDKNLSELLKCTEPFRVMCHGDCWTNNFLFKFHNNQAIDCCMLDMQVIRIGSPALDLNHLVWTSVNHEVRKSHLPDLLKDYYDSFSSVMSAAARPMPFTFEELQKEFDSKNLFGLYMALILLKPILIKREDIPDLRNIHVNEVEDTVSKCKALLQKIESYRPLAIPTYMALFDQLDEAGLFTDLNNQ